MSGHIRTPAAVPLAGRLGMGVEAVAAVLGRVHDRSAGRWRRDLSADQVAALFSMTSRTMNRRLSTYGLSFRNLVDEGRYEIARQALIDTDNNVSHVAALLGYDASSFVRAFQRWSGKSPSQWQSEQQTREQRTDGARSDRA